jgi:hypothetical protein
MIQGFFFNGIRMNGGNFIITQRDEFTPDILPDHAYAQLSFLKGAGVGTEIAFNPVI